MRFVVGNRTSRSGSGVRAITANIQPQRPARSATESKVFAPAFSTLAGKFLRQMEAVEKWNCAHDPERAIEQPPRERNMADVSANESERNDGRAGNQTAAQHPGIANWISKWSDEKQRDDQMPEGEPVSPITDKRKSGVGRFETEEHEGDPSPKSRNELISGGVVDAEPAAKKRQFLE
jgi:hypothetical protein